MGKRPGDRLLSGSFVVAGAGGYQATEVGAGAYARRLAAEARRFGLVRSELMDGINRILLYVTWVIVPLAVLLLASQLRARDTVREALTGVVAALVGVVPQGLVLLTSVAFGVAAITLARRRVLVQQLPAVEGLARVDVLCVDKTGTLTDGTIAFGRLIRLGGQAPVAEALGALAAEEDRNATLGAIGRAFPPPAGWERTASVPFSSARKWSAASFTARGTWVLGAPEMVLPSKQQAELSQAAELAADGYRVLVLAHAVFGRVTPHQKEAMVKALQARGHTVAMTGDGVNDVLALKLADLGIAIGSGAAATKAVAELVLLDSRFATLPGVVAEGRRVTANIERVANLFVTKTVWTALLAIAVGLTLLPYPFLPRHLTIIDTLTIGVPSFFLALAPNQRRYLPGFASRVLRFAIPADCIVAAATFAAFALARAAGLTLVQQRTAAVLVAFILSLCVLVLLAIPLTWRRILLVCAALAGFAMLFPLPVVRRFYALELPRGELGITLLIAAIGAAALAAYWRISRRPRP